MPLQIPQLDDRNFQQIVDEVVARIPAHTPEWNNFNQSDPGITLVQLFAYMMENLLYRSNRIPEANRKKFLSLLRLPLRPAGPSYGLATFVNDRGPVQEIPLDVGVELYAGKVPFRTRTPINVLPVTATIFYKKVKQDLGSAEQTRYQELYQSLAEGNNPATFSFYESTVLEPPAAGKAAPIVDLALNGDTIDNTLWMALVAPKNVSLDLVKQALSEQTLTLGVYPDVTTPRSFNTIPEALEPILLENRKIETSELRFEIAMPSATQDATVNQTPVYVPLGIEYVEDVLKLPGIVQLTLPSAEKLQVWELDAIDEGTRNFPPLVEDRELAGRIITWIRITLAHPDQANAQTGGKPARLTWVGINAARIVQSLRVKSERIGVGTGTPNQSFKVANTPVIMEHPLNMENLSPPEETFRLELTNIDGSLEVWQRVDDIYSAAPADKVFTLDPESGQVQCGDGLRGKRFPLGAVIRASYEYGGGLQGKLAIGALNKAPSLPAGIKVSNPVETWGASEAETVDDGERRISRFLRHRDRLVTEEDFREIALQTPNVNIGRVEVLPLFDPTDTRNSTLLPTVSQSDLPAIGGTVTVMVVPRHPLDQATTPDPDKVTLDAVCAWLDPRRLITSRVFVRGPIFVPLIVTVAVQLLPGQISAVVNRDVKAALRSYLSPLVGGIPPKGSTTGSGFPLASELRPQDLEAVVARVSGVRFVKALKLAYIAVDKPTGVETVTVLDKASTTLDRLFFVGLRLPWLAHIDVREADAALDPSQFSENPTSSPGQPPTLPVPVQPGKKC